MGRKRTESAEKEKKDDDMGRKIDTKTKWWKNMKKEEKTSREAYFPDNTNYDGKQVVKCITLA